MNTPNKLTIMRIILVPFFVLFLFSNYIYFNFLWALVIFIFACITDAIDGYIARKNNCITTLGKFLDPLADKVLVMSALISFMELQIISYIVIIIILSREFLVTSLRLVAAEKKVVIVASKLGKIKTVIHMISIILVLAILNLYQLNIITNFEIVRNTSEFLMWICVIISIVSCVEYLYINRNMIIEK